MAPAGAEPLKRETLFCLGDRHPYSAFFTGDNDIFCIDLLSNWLSVSEEESIFSLYGLYLY